MTSKLFTSLPVAVVMAAASLAMAPHRAYAACTGDCNNDGEVTVDELLAIVNIGIGNDQLSSCTAGDANGDGQITIDEVLAAVNNALNGCGTPVPTATPLNTNTPTPTNGVVTHMVVVGPNGMLVFSPAELSIHTGETVQWTWASSGHNVVSGSACTADTQFCSPSDSSCAQTPLSNQSATYAHTFTAAGTFTYFCSAHCDLGMVGTITVQ